MAKRTNLRISNCERRSVHARSAVLARVLAHERNLEGLRQCRLPMRGSRAINIKDHSSVLPQACIARV